MAHFQSFWAGQLSPYEFMCLRSFCDNGHSFDLYTFAKDLDVPAGVRLRDAAEVLGPENFFVYQDGPGKGSPAAFANLFRYKLLAERGGWWVDTDVLCLSDQIPEYGTFFATEDGALINIAVLRFPAQHQLILRCFDEATRMGRNVRWGDSGPYLFTRLATEFKCLDDAVSTRLCYPIHHSEAADILRPSHFVRLEKQTQGALFVHLYNASLALRGVHKTLLPPEGSMLRHWLKKHPAEGWSGMYDPQTAETLFQHA